MLNIFKTKKVNSKESAVSGRRSFMWKMGAGVSSALAAAPSLANSLGGKDEGGLAIKVAVLEEENKLRKLHQTYQSFMDQGNYAAVPALFSEDGEVIFNGGVFKNKNQGVSRLYNQSFQLGMTGNSMESAPGFEIDADQLQEKLEVAADRLSATAKFSYSIQVGKLIDSDSQLFTMARLQGEGVQKWWEGGVYELSYVRNATEDDWKIKSLEYKTLSRADYRPGRSYSKPITVPELAVLFPNDAMGPDKLV